MRLFRRRPDASFSVDIPPEMTQGMTFGGNIAPRISRREALQVPAVLRSRNLIAGTLARLPVHVRDRERRINPPTNFLDQIDPDVPNIVTFASTFEDLLFEGLSWWRITDFGWHDYPTYATHVDTARVSIVTTATGSRVYVDGYPVPDAELIRFDSPNPPLLVHAARAIRACLELDQAAYRYSNSPYPLGYFTPREGTRVKEDPVAVEEMLNKWEEGRRRHAWAYIGSAWEGKQFQFDAEQIQLADQRQHAVLEIARAAGVDPEDLGVSTTSRTYQNSEQRRQDLVDFTLAPYMTAVEERLSMRDVLPRGYEAKFNLDGFLRGDTLGRFQAHQIALTAGFETIEEVRGLEDLPPLPPSERPTPPPVLVPAPMMVPNGGSNGNGNG
ncbi:MAG TPA: phage portal protein [Actinomycetota bacterium]|nr:phage portal protein [Actinomycetota bacterium]